MDWWQKLSENKHLQDELYNFLNKYGLSALREALQLYIDQQQDYLCKTKTSITKIKIHDIYYLEIQGHDITIYTLNETYKKYGSLNNELKLLSYYGFVKCNQSCIVSLSKIRTVRTSDIILINNTKLHMTKNYATKVLIAYHRKLLNNKA